MAQYPAVPVHISSTIQLLDAIKVSRARAGAPKARRWYSATRVGQIDVVHVGLTNAQRDAVETFLRANRTVTFTFLWCYGNTVYTVIWGDERIEWEDVGAGLSSTKVTLIPVI